MTRHFPKSARGPVARGRQAGNATAEVAIVLPVMLFMVLGLVDLGRGLAAKSALGQAVRAATRYASVRSSTSGDPATQSKIATYLRGQITSLDTDAIEVTTEWSPSNNRGSKVQVNVRYTFAPIMPFIPVSSVELTSSSESIISN